MTRKLKLDTGEYELFGIYFNGPKAFDRLNQEYPELPYLGKYTSPDHCDHCDVATFYGAILLKFNGSGEDALLQGFIVIAEECATTAFPASVEQFAKLKNFGRRHRRASARPPAASPVPPSSVPTQGTKAAPIGNDVLIEGVVISTDVKIHPKHGPQVKMTVQCDGWRAYSTVPAAIKSEVNENTGNGKRVRLIATKTFLAGDKTDKHFCLVYRPRDAVVL